MAYINNAETTSVIPRNFSWNYRKPKYIEFLHLETMTRCLIVVACFLQFIFRSLTCRSCYDKNSPKEAACTNSVTCWGQDTCQTEISYMSGYFAVNKVCTSYSNCINLQTSNSADCNGGMTTSDISHKCVYCCQTDDCNAVDPEEADICGTGAFQTNSLSKTSGTCTEGQTTYRVIRVDKTWDEARIYCQDLGMELATPQTQAEASAFKDWLVALSSNLVWIGYRHQADGTVLLPDGNTIDELPFVPTRVSIFDTLPQGDCEQLYVTGTENALHNTSCTDTLHFVCQGSGGDDGPDTGDTTMEATTSAPTTTTITLTPEGTTVQQTTEGSVVNSNATAVHPNCQEIAEQTCISLENQGTGSRTQTAFLIMSLLDCVATYMQCGGSCLFFVQAQNISCQFNANFPTRWNHEVRHGLLSL